MSGKAVTFFKKTVLIKRNFIVLQSRFLKKLFAQVVELVDTQV